MQAGTTIRSILDATLDTIWPARKARASLRERWGKPGDKQPWLASDYFDRMRGRNGLPVMDDRTWLDLEYPRIFGDMDTTMTPLGSQRLYDRLRVYTRDERELRARYDASDTLRIHADTRERIQLALKPMQDDGFADIAAFLLDPAPAPMRHRGWIALWGLASLGVLAGVIVHAWPLGIWLGMLGVNLVVLARASRFLFRDVDTLKYVTAMIWVAETLASDRRLGNELPDVRRLRAESASRRRVARTLRGFAFMQRPLVSWIGIWLNFMFLLDISVYNLTIERFMRVREALIPTFECLGDIDASLAVAGYLQRHRAHCLPQFTDDPVIDLDQARHPLIEHPVPNDITLARQSLLVTGSNMAGKTTFIKTVGIQLLLAQTLGFCLADRARVPRVPVMSSIRGDHSVASGKSHYFGEVEAIRSFLGVLEQGGTAVFLIDELFSGTNTVERIAAARAVLESLSRQAIVLVTTHDVELQSLMPERFVLCHFQENPDIEGFFDYRLRPGRASERNAIRLLARMGFPEAVVDDAMNYADAP